MRSSIFPSQNTIPILDRAMSMDDIEQFLQNFPNLTHLEINDVFGRADMDVADGYRCEMLTQRLVSFDFIFHVTNYLTEQNFDSFQTPFWTEEKH
ncbi:unnamed protein product [Adineta ricciae]|uniref:Uncharacterized protein n=1 Tax=Adineta ricciae TaxID=249248 RepID=A0A815QH29_ADIRI|nr:unnamed protein product [Adineta ricciae]CAF1657978.1 unnamed protein product [Adineta ricciae]